MKETRNHKGQIEVLLLLCCAVGVVAFMSFALGAVNLLSKVEEQILDYPQLIEERNHLTARVSEQEAEVARYQKEIEKFKKSIDLPDPSVNQETLRTLESEYERLLQMKRELEEHIRRIRQILSSQSPTKNDAELRKIMQILSERLKELERKIKETRDELLKKPSLTADSLKDDIDKLKRDIEKAIRRKAELAHRRSKVDAFNPWKDFPGGDLDLKNPLFVECKEEFIVIHPEKRVLAVSALSTQNPFVTLHPKNDGIVFLVRPTGFKSFNESYALARKTNLPIAYEPIDSGWTLDLAKE